jgi:hypothetical protein
MSYPANKNIKIMKMLFLLTLILITSCNNKKDDLVKRQDAIKKEIDQVKAAYFKQADSLENIKRTDTSSAKQYEISIELLTADYEKIKLLIPLQKEYDSLAAVLQK